MIFVTWIWYHLLAFSSSVSLRFVCWIGVLSCGEHFPSKPPCRSGNWDVTLCCLKSPGFEKAVALFTPAEDLPHTVLHGQTLMGQRAKTSPQRTSAFLEYYFTINLVSLPSARRVDVSGVSPSFLLPLSSSNSVLEGLQELMYPELACLCLGDACSC